MDGALFLQVGHPGGQVLHSGGGNEGGLLADGGQPGLDRLGQLDLVEAQDRKVAGNGDVCLVQRHDAADGEKVVAEQKGGGTAPLKQALDAAIAAVDVVFVPEDPLFP